MRFYFPLFLFLTNCASDSVKSNFSDVRNPAAEAQSSKDGSLKDKFDQLEQKLAADNNSRGQTADELRLKERRDEALRTVIDVLSRAKTKPNPSQLIGEVPSFLNNFDTHEFRYGTFPVELQASLDSVSGPIFYESFNEICSIKLISGSRTTGLGLGYGFNYLEGRCLSKSSGAVARRFRITYKDNHEIKNVKSIEEDELLYKGK